MFSPLNHYLSLNPILTRKHYALLSLLYFAIVIYGSLVPFHFESVDGPTALARFQSAFSLHQIHSRSDTLANFLLFIPMSFLLSASFAVDRRWIIGLVALFPTVALCGVGGLAIEFVQVYFPERKTDINDFLSQIFGSFFGATAWLCVGQRLTQAGRHICRDYLQPTPVGLWLVGLLFLVVLTHLWPLDLTMSPGDLYHKYKAGRVRLIPFQTAAEDGALFWMKSARTLILFLPVGLLAAFLPVLHSRRWPYIIAFAFVSASLVEFLQIFVQSRDVDASDIVTGSLAVLVGWLLSIFVQHRVAAHGCIRGAGLNCNGGTGIPTRQGPTGRDALPTVSKSNITHRA